MFWACPISPCPVGSWEVPLVKDTTPQPTLTQYCRKQLLDKNKEAPSTSPLKMATVLF